MHSLWQDLTYSFRSLAKSPGLTVAALVTFGLGIGVAVTVFAFINAMLFGPVPFAEPERAVYIWSTDRQAGQARTGVALADFTDWQERSRSFEKLAAFQSAAATLGGNPPQRLGVLAVSADFFAVLGARPLIGRTFVPEDRGDARLAVVSHGLWQERFGGDRGLVGRTILLDGQPFTVAGVMPPDFWFPSQQVKLWRLLDLRPSQLDRASGSASVIGLRRHGVGLAAARVELETLAASLAQSHPETNAGRGARVVPISLELLDAGDRMAVVLLGLTVLFVLLIACVNVANLLLARGLARRGEVALRVALGARRGRIARQLLTESLLLAVASGALGLIAASWGAGGLLAIFPRSMPLPARVIDGRVVAVAMATTLVATLLAGVLPALRASRLDPRNALQAASSGQAARSRRPFKVLVAAEITLALTLLIVSGLMIRTLVYLQRMDVGFQTREVLTARIDLPADRYLSAARLTAFFDQLLQRAASLREVDAAAATSQVPFAPGASAAAAFTIEGRAPVPKPPRALYSVITPAFFDTLKVGLLRGRAFSTEDAAGSVPVAVVNERLARRHWPGESPLGRRIRLEGIGKDESAGAWLSIVGVVEDVRAVHPAFEPQPQIYLPHAQHPAGAMVLVVRSPAAAATLAAAMRSEVWKIDREIALYDLKPLGQLLRDRMALPRAFFGMLAAIAGLALLLAATGIYGVTAYAVRQRTHEIGIRTALGADQGKAVRLVVGEGMRLVLIGIAIGALTAFGLGRAISSMLYGVAAGDPITFGGVIVILVGVGLLANYLPARRATRITPMETLRIE